MAVNTITGTTGNDLLQGQQLSGTQNLINGLAGNDTLLAATVADSLNGGAGNDSLSFGTALTVNNAFLVGGLGNDSFYANGATILSSSYEGNSGNDLFSFTAAGSISSASIRGGEGADTIVVQTGVNVTYNGLVATLGQGADVFTVGTGSSSTNVQVFGGKDNDTLTLAGTYNAVSIGGNEGSDRVFLQGLGVTLTNSLIGLGKGHDLITTTAGGGTLLSTVGTLVGGEGQDTITVGLSAVSNFQIWGDTLAENGDSTVGLQDLIVLSANQVTAGLYASVYGGAGNDTILLNGTANNAQTGQGINFFGGQGNDSISLAAAGAAMTLRGGAGNDTLIANFIFTGGANGTGQGLFSANNFNGGAGVDQIVFATTGRANFQINTAITGTFGNTVLSNFTDSGDQILLQGLGTNSATFSAINAINTGANTFAGQATTGRSDLANITGKFVYNLTGGFSSFAESGFGIGSVNIFEANGDTIIQLLAATTGTTGVSFGGAISAKSTGMKLQFVLSGNLGIIDNATAGFLTGVNLTFGVASDNTNGRNGFTITLA